MSAVCRPAALRLRGPTVGRRISIRRPGQAQPPPGTQAAPCPQSVARRRCACAGLRLAGASPSVGRVRCSRHPAHKRLRVRSLSPGGAALARAYGQVAQIDLTYRYPPFSSFSPPFIYCALCSLLIINTNEIPLFISTGFHQRRSGGHRTGSQYQQQAEAGDRRAQYYLADTWVSSGDYQKAEYWAQKAAAQGDGDALALLAQLKIRNPQQADYPQARQLAEKAVEAGSKSGEIVLARVLVNRQAGATDVAHAITLLQDAARDSESDAAVDAQMLLGLIYASGVHGPEDDVKASEYFKGSSSLSRTGYAEYWAGMMFQQGEKGFIEPNKQKALHWLNVSCPEGFDTGCEEFDRISKG